MNVLAISTFFLLLPIFVFLRSKRASAYEYILVLLLSVNILTSFVFWSNPIHQPVLKSDDIMEISMVHLYDGIFAKISFICFMFYIFFIKIIDFKYKVWFFIFLVLSSYTFYYSDAYSTDQWCSHGHIWYHLAFHIFVSMGASIAFL